MFTQEFSVAVGMLAIRVLLGFLFFFQGYDKIFRIKTEGILNTFADLIAQRNLSRNFIRPLVTASSFIEMICGAFLAFGIFREITLYLLAVDMLLVAFMFGLLKPLWDMSHYFPRFVLLVLLLLLPPEWDKFHLGFLFNF